MYVCCVPFCFLLSLFVRQEVYHFMTLKVNEKETTLKKMCICQHGYC